MCRNTGTFSTELFWRTFGHTSTSHPNPPSCNQSTGMKMLRWTAIEARLACLSKNTTKLLQSSYRIPSYVITNWMKKHCLWQILSCLGVRERVGRLDLQPAVSRAPGSTPCRWAKSRRSPVAKVPVAVGPRSKALQVPLVQLVHGTHFQGAVRTDWKKWNEWNENTKASELKTPLPCIPWRYSWPRGCLARNITWVSYTLNR